MLPVTHHGRDEAQQLPRERFSPLADISHCAVFLATVNWGIRVSKIAFREFGPLEFLCHGY